jgi:DNA gyrase/topoisomerase IV subunit A
VHPPRSENSGDLRDTTLDHEVEKRYLAYALSTIVARALPDVRDGLKPVHRRILYAMHGMRLNDAARMRKSAAVVGEVIGKFHPHGDQAAYDAMVRMAQDFSLRYPLIDGSGNFGSLDGDSPAAMRYTETRLSAFAGTLLREIDQGTTEFHPTYDAMGEEPDVLPAALPNLLLNGSSGIAVGMSCSFPPHNLKEVVAGCRAMIRDRNLDVRGLLTHIQGPDFPTGGEVVDQLGRLEEIYSSGHGSIVVRGTYEEENLGRGKVNLIVTSIPYSVNKSRLIERIAMLIKDKRLKQVYDVRDESTQDVRIVLELRGGDVRTESVMAFLYKHSDLQINFPVNFIAITPQGVPDRLGLDKIIGHFLDFRYEKTVMRLQHRLEILQKRIHILLGFEILFIDLDLALKIIRSARSRQEAEQGLKESFGLDDEQVDAILEMRLYKLVGLEIGKLLDELAEKRREAAQIAEDLGSPERLWKIIDGELAEIGRKFGDDRRTKMVEERKAVALEYDPEEFVEHEDTTVILSRQGWIRRMKSEVEDASALKFREGDGLFGLVRVNTGRTVAIFSNQGKVYVLRAMDVPATTGFGEPIGNLLNFGDGEFVVGFIAPDPVTAKPAVSEPDVPVEPEEGVDPEEDQPDLFGEVAEPTAQEEAPSVETTGRGVLITRKGQGFRFDYDILREPSKRMGRKLVNLRGDDEIAAVKVEDAEMLAVATDAGHILLFKMEEVSTLTGAGQGVRMMRLTPGAEVVAMEPVNPTDRVKVLPKKGKEKTLAVASMVSARRGGLGKKYYGGINGMERMRDAEEITA